VQAIADDTAATKLTGRDPIRAGELTMDEIERWPGRPRLPPAHVQGAGRGPPHQGPALHAGVQAAGQAGRHRLDHPQPPGITDGQIGKLIGTTRTTIAAIRDRSHWNIANIQPKDPVTLGLCSQRELDGLVAKAAKAAGHEGGVDEGKLAGDREALIHELRAEREANARQAEAAHAAELAGTSPGSGASDEGFRDPFRS
jgi:hypothetical protein